MPVLMSVLMHGTSVPRVVKSTRESRSSRPPKRGGVVVPLSLELKALLQGQLQPYMRNSWMAYNEGDHDGQMALCVTVGRARHHQEKTFDQLDQLTRRYAFRGSQESIERYRKTLDHMRENGIEITDDPASKWLPLQRKQAEDLRSGNAAATLRATIAEITKDSSPRSSKEPRSTGPAAPGQ